MAGVTIHFTLGGNGILKNAEIAGEKYEEANAKEQLTLELANIQTKKYKETGKKATLEDVKNLINKNKYDVTIEEGGSSATIEDFEKEYTFIVDEKLNIQDVEKIANQDKNIKIETTVENAKDYTNAKIKAKITSPEELKSVKIAGNIIELISPTKEGDNFIYNNVEKIVEENRNYKIKAETVSGKANSKLQNVTEISEDMDIYTTDDLVKFRDRVNIGATYIGKTINVREDIELNNVCYRVDGTTNDKSWEPIGNYAEDTTHEFKGTFNGNSHTIKNIYINVTNGYQGLFGMNSGTINNLKVTGKIVTSGSCAGGVTGFNKGTIKRCTNEVLVEGHDVVGGISGNNAKDIEECSNLVRIHRFLFNGWRYIWMFLW